MEQRTYQGNLSPEGLADYVVAQYNGQGPLQAQKVGQGDSLLVQIGESHNHHGRFEMSHALTLGIHRPAGDETGLVVTMGAQQWITPELATYAAMMALISILVTPWALFALLWPASRILGSRVLPTNVWNTVETYALSQGAVAGPAQTLEHPHLGTPAPAAPAPMPGGAAILDPEKTQKLS